MLVDRFLKPFELLIKRMTAKYNYAGKWTYKVIGQNPDNSLELRPIESSNVPPLSKVKIICNSPGMVTKVKEGAIGYVEFADFDPSRPLCVGFDPDTSKFISVEIGENAAKVVRNGDLIASGGAGQLITLMPLSGVGAPPSNAVVAGVPHLVSFSAIPPTPALADPLYGVAVSGSDKLLAST